MLYRTTRFIVDVGSTRERTWLGGCARSVGGRRGLLVVVARSASGVRATAAAAALLVG